MAHSYDKKKDEITIYGWEKGIAPSPHQGIGDIKCGNISTEMGEVSVNFIRSRLDNVPVVGGTFAVTNGSADLVYTGTNLKNGTWIHITAITGATGFTNGNYYFVTQDFGVGANKYLLSASLNGGPITPSADGTITFSTLNIGVPVDYAVENTTSADAYRYYVIDSTGIVWCSGAAGSPCAAGVLSTSTVWTAITPSGSSTRGVSHNSGTPYGISTMYATTAGSLTHTFLIVFSDTGVWYLQSPSAGGAFTLFLASNVLTGQSGQPHKAILGVDQVIYFTDGAYVGFLYQTSAATAFDPATASTYTFSHGAGANFIPYSLNNGDTSTRISQLPTGAGGSSIIIGGLQNNLYIFPSAKTAGASTGQPVNLLWLPEANTQYLIQANNFVVIFAGQKGNIYLTNGSSVVPLITVPDYIAGSASFIQEPYFTWGGAAYIRGRIFFSIKDQTASHTGNCGGIWSFVPTFAVFAQQDIGSSLRLEQRSAAGTLGTTAYNGYAPVIIAGYESTSQTQGNGPQYAAFWDQTTGGTTSIDFSGTTPYADGSTIIETDFIPVGTLYKKTTFKQIECALASALATGETIAVNYRTDLEVAFASAGTVITESANPLAAITNQLTFEKAQSIQLQIILTSTASSPSYVRLKTVYLR